MVKKQLVFKQKGICLLHEIMEFYGLKSVKEALNFVLSEFKWCINKAAEGKAIGALNTDHTKFTELVAPCLTHAKRSDIRNMEATP